MKRINIIGACSDLGEHITGTKLGPEILENKIEKNNISKIINIKQKHIKKELDKNNLKKNLSEINKYNTELYNNISDSLNNDMFPLTLGGDHSVVIASALASLKKHNNLGIIWFDAHGDYNTFETTTSGNIHGLPFAVITNYEKKYLTPFHNGPFFNPKNAVLVGASDIDKPFELENLKKAGVTIFTADDIKKYGTAYVYKKAFEIASNETNGIHISWDIDVVDPRYAPGVSIPTINGITLEDAYSFKDYIIKNKKLVKSLDFVEFNPLNDIDNITENISVKILNDIIKDL